MSAPSTIPSFRRSLLLTPDRKAKIFNRSQLTVLPYQRMIHRSDARFRVVDGGRRIGKSVIGGREAFAQLVIPGSYVWIVGPTMDLAEKEFRVVWQLAVNKGMLPVRRKSGPQSSSRVAYGGPDVKH